MTECLIRIFIKDRDNLTDCKVRQKYGMLGGIVGIICNILLFCTKFLAGLVTGAVSVMADAFNNLSDAASSVVTLIGFHMAGKPADLDHPFGHGRIEYLSGLFVAGAILLMGVELLKSSLDKILHPAQPEFQVLSVVILAAAILVKLWLAGFNFKVGGKISSEAMKATAMDSLSDCIATLAVLFGILLTHFAGINVDGWIGACVAGFVLIAGIKAAKETIQPLLGMSPDPELVSEIYDAVMAHEMVLGIHDMLVHDYGPGRRMVSFHAEVSYKTDILEAHDQIDNIERELKERFQCDVTIHMDPVITDDEELNHTKELVQTLICECNEHWQMHDFRMVKGNTHNNVIFDLVVEAEDLKRAGEIEKMIKEKIHKADTRLFAVVTVEQSFT